MPFTTIARIFLGRPPPRTVRNRPTRNHRCCYYGMCFGMDTLVTTSSGNQKLMKDLKIGEEVLSDETGRLTKFIGWIELNSNTKNKMIEVETDDGEKLIMSDTHIVFSYEEDKPTPTYVKDLSPGNVLVGGTGKVQIPPTCVKIFRVISFISSREK